MKQTKLNWIEKNVKRGVEISAGVLAVLGMVGVMPEVFQGGANATGEIVADSDTSEVIVNLSPVLGIGVYSSAAATTEIDEVSIEALPSSSGTFYSEDAYVGVSTNAADGYTLKISMNNNSSNALVHSDSSAVTAQIGPAGTNVTSSTMGVNTWGYAASGGTNYNAVPLSGSPTTIKTTSAPTAVDSTNTDTGRAIDTTQVNFGTKIDTSLPAGTYSNEVLFTAVTNASS